MRTRSVAVAVSAAATQSAITAISTQHSALSTQHSAISNRRRRERCRHGEMQHHGQPAVSVKEPRFESRRRQMHTAA
eukprot:2807203-Prymnesium_polylepis.1